MSATDPLREALAELTQAVAPVTANPRYSNPGRPCVSYEHLSDAVHRRLLDAARAAREALAAVPAEPESDAAKWGAVLGDLDSRGLEANPIGTRAALKAVSERNDKRAAFLAGHGTLDALEVWAWAAELGGDAAESAIESDEPLMVSVLRSAETEDKVRKSLLDEVNELGAECARLEAEVERLRPAEPEAWEWRAVVEGHRRTPYRSVAQDEQSARDFAADLARDIPHGVVSVERRRAPGPWERVDPEPREED